MGFVFVFRVIYKVMVFAGCVWRLCSGSVIDLMHSVMYIACQGWRNRGNRVRVPQIHFFGQQSHSYDYSPGILQNIPLVCRGEKPLKYPRED
ncbi:hypothetical protein BXZ70DRAFT_673767 [Cristinia sonorae]|uniref:Uncharacterized protein n=1 Tax=Cristinia sonorae TaxID=1940300 RepID=A0A8K0UUM5_9AGAR|nr:hypothetical protein BXZ70DRAFT_673767 [Cristinia sonorae]